MALTRYHRERDWYGPTRWTDVHEELVRYREDELNEWLSSLFGLPVAAEDQPEDLAQAIEDWGAQQWGMPPETALDVLAIHWSEKQPLGLRQPTIIIPAWLLRPGMRIATPDFVKTDDPGAPASLIVDLWDLQDGESLLVLPDDPSQGYDYNTGDYPEFVQLLPARRAPTRALALVNRHRASLGLPPLDPVAAGWSEQDVLVEAERIGALTNPATMDDVGSVKKALLAY